MPNPTAARQGRRVAAAGGPFALRASYRRALDRRIDEAEAAGADPADVARARRDTARAESQCARLWVAQDHAYRHASRPVATPRARTAPRPRSRRAGASSGTSSADPGDDGGEPEPPGLALWWHPRWGRCTPRLLALLLRADREGAGR